MHLRIVFRLKLKLKLKGREGMGWVVRRGEARRAQRVYLQVRFIANVCNRIERGWDGCLDQ